MNESKHTPGPWVARAVPSSKWETEILDEEGYSIFAITKIGPRQAVCNRANALLIAAAPDMLATLEELLNVFDNNLSADWRGIITRAISKARGTA